MNELTALVKINGKSTLYVPDNAQRVIKMRLNRFNQYLAETDQNVMSIPLAGYVEWLKEYRNKQTGQPLSASAIASYVNSVRGTYRKMLSDNATREALFNSLDSEVSFTDKKAIVDEFYLRVRNELDSTSISAPKRQDSLASEHTRLTASQAESLINKPGLDTLQSLRDTAIIALMIATGIREQELCDLTVDDLRVMSQDNALCLHVRKGKGDKGRLVPYGQMAWVLPLVDKWLEKADIKGGPVFISYFKGFEIKRGKMTGRAIQNILKAYPITVNGRLTTLKPHDLRRTYAKLHYDTRNDIVSLSHNLGHSSIDTTRRYIGSDDMQKRSPGLLVSFDLDKLSVI